MSGLHPDETPFSAGSKELKHVASVSHVFDQLTNVKFFFKALTSLIK